MATPIVLPERIGGTSFGPKNTSWGPESTFGVRSLLSGERYRTLDRKQSFYDCTQHGSKIFDFDGRVISTGAGGSATQPMLSSEKAHWVPLRMRRPSSPYRLCKVIVDAFTNMVFGEQRFPAFRVAGDDKTQDWVQTVARVGQLPVRMIRARALGGAVGTVGVSWGFIDGRPRFEVHNGKHLFVHRWEDREQLIPEHVSEIYLYTKEEWVPEKKRFMPVWYWYRRDWLPDTDVIFKPVKFEANVEPQFEPDPRKSVIHNDGVTHFEWIQNLPSHEVDGLTDCEGLYDTFDALDTLLSVVMRGATLNLDPTLVLKMDLDYVQRMGVKKGSDNALAVGPEGDAHYLELGGQSIDAGLKLFNDTRRYALEVAQCVVADPDKLAAAGMSSVALKGIYAPMLSKADILREQYGTPMARMLERMNRAARESVGRKIVIFNSDGVPEEVELEIKLPPKVMKEPAEIPPPAPKPRLPPGPPELDSDGNPVEDEPELPEDSGEQEVEQEGPKITVEEREPGDGGEVDAKWGPYFMPTPSDVSQQASAMQIATGQKQFVSQQSAAEAMAVMLGHEPDDEWERLQKEHAAHEEKVADMFAGGAGGQVSHTTELPSGATVRRTAEMGTAPEEEVTDDDTTKGNVSVTPQDASAIITVNEARASMGLPPLEVDGELTLAEFKTKHADEVAKAANANLGKVGEPADANPPPPPSPFGGPPHPGGPDKPPFGGPPGGPPGKAPPFGAKTPGEGGEGGDRPPPGKPFQGPPAGPPGGPPQPPPPFPPKKRKPFPPK